MGWLKKHLNPNPIKQIKTQVSDVKKSLKGPSGLMGKKKAPSASTGTPTASSNLSASSGKLPSYKQSQLNKLPGASTKPKSTSGVYTTGQGNAPAPKKITAAQVRKSPTAVAPAKTIRTSAARVGLNSLGTPGKNRFK